MRHERDIQKFEIFLSHYLFYFESFYNSREQDWRKKIEKICKHGSISFRHLIRSTPPRVDNFLFDWSDTIFCSFNVKTDNLTTTAAVKPQRKANTTRTSLPLFVIIQWFEINHIVLKCENCCKMWWKIHEFRLPHFTLSNSLIISSKRTKAVGWSIKIN